MAELEMEKVAIVIARSLAFLCLQNTEVKEGTLLQQANFLSALGLPFADAAKMLGSTAESLRVMAYQKGKRAKGASNGKEAKGKAKTKRNAKGKSGKRTR